MHPLPCLIDDLIEPYPYYQKAKRWSGVMQAGVTAAIASWMIVPAMRMAAWHSPAMFGLLPLLTLGLIIDAHVEVKQYQAIAVRKHRTMSLASKWRVVFAVSAAAIGGLALSAWLLGLFSGVALGALPYLAVAVVALRVLYQLSNVLVSYEQYRQMSHEQDRVSGRQAVAAEVFKLGVSSLLVIAVVGLLLVPFPPGLLISLIALSAVATAALAGWHSAPSQWRRPIKQRYELFKKNVEPDSPVNTPDEFGLPSGSLPRQKDRFCRDGRFGV